MSRNQHSDPVVTPSQPEDGSTFGISGSSLRRRNRYNAAGFVFAGALCLIIRRAMLDSDDTYNETLLGAVIVTLILLGAFQIVGHARWLRKSRRHRVVVGEDRIFFETGEEQTVLILADVLRVERQKRMQEGPSLLIRLRNGRFVRLEGYEHQELLTERVIERFGALAGRGPEGSSKVPFED